MTQIFVGLKERLVCFDDIHFGGGRFTKEKVEAEMKANLYKRENCFCKSESLEAEVHNYELQSVPENGLQS